MYQTLYRKYRPSNFDEVVGQKVIIKTLKNAIVGNKLSHAYLFSGPRGTGKTSIAKILAKTINCTDLKEYNPCNKCVNCTQNNNNPLDIIEIDAASNNGVDEIREIKSKVNLVPSIGKYKVYIIDEVHMLSTGAFNALLKTLEEPPSHVIFILATTDPHKIPATILSRCQRFDFKKLTISEINEKLSEVAKKEKIDISDESLNEIAILSDGGMRDALSLLDQVIAYSDKTITLEDIHEINGTIAIDEQVSLIDNIISNNIEEVFKKINKYYNDGKDFIKLTEELILFFRNVLLKLNTPKFYKDNYNDRIPNCFLEKLDNKKIVEYVSELNSSINDMKNSNNPRTIFELLVIKLLNGEDNKPIKKEQNLKEIRVNNTLCNFNKKQMIEFLPTLDKLNEYNNHTKYNDYIKMIQNGKLKAIGKENIIFVLDDSSEFNNNINIVDELFYKVYGVKYHVISVTSTEWETIKEEFNSKKKEYKYIEEE